MGTITLNPTNPADMNPQVEPHLISWSGLLEMRNTGTLIPGQWYRITDYVTTVNSYTNPNARSAGHGFDILVMAESEGALCETAYAVRRKGDTYFRDARIEAWELRYRLDNVQWSEQKGTYMSCEGYSFTKLGTVDIDGTTYILWKGDNTFYEDWDQYAVTEDEEEGTAVLAYSGEDEPGDEVGSIEAVGTITEEGKGTIIWMKDEFGNECPYDFKNIQFKRWLCTDGIDGREGLDGLYMVANPNNLPQDLTVDDEEDFIWAFTFSSDNSGGEQEDYSLGGHNVHDNVFKPKSDGSLANNVMYGEYNYANSFGVDCYDNSWGNSCYDNSWGNYCYYNSWGNSCQYNSWGNSCYDNSWGNSCSRNSWGNGCDNNSWGNYCYSNSWGNDCDNNSWGNSCQYNSWGNDCRRNSWGNNCFSNSLGNYCYYNSWGNEVTYTTVFDGVQYTQITTEKVKYAQVLNGVAGTSSSKLTLTFAANKSYTQVACLTTAGVPKIQVPGDL